MLKKIFTLAMPLMASLTFSLTADQDFLGSCCESNPCCPEPVCCEESFGNFFLRGDLLYWTSRISNLEGDFGRSDTSQSLNDCVLTTRTCESHRDPHWKWRAGYRIVAGYQMPCSDLEFAAMWTSFQPNSKKHHRDDDDCDDFSTGGRTHLKFNQLDVVALYNIKKCPSLTLRPYFGVRAAEIKNHIDVNLVSEITLPTAIATETRSLFNQQKFRGIGPVFGINADWDVMCGFGAYGTAGASLLYGDYKIRSCGSDIFTAPISNEIFTSSNRHLHHFVWNIDLALGVRWQTCLFESMYLSLKLGFEHHQYFEYNRLGCNNGDLTFDGGVFSVGLAY